MSSYFLSRFALLSLLMIAVAPGQNFEEGVRSTPHRSPEEERKAFRLPPGFEIQLVAAEPDIQKPMNLAFDASGRLWVTDSVEYPYAAPPDRKGRDTIKILEDTDGDGRADKITTFADGLNIPIGLYPYGKGVIAFSIPHITYYQDTDGDGKSDKQDILYGPLGYERDTHGMNNAFRRGFDGWLYIAHGFNNESTIRGRDGSELKLVSGNTYRVRLDGSRVEPYTFGQVNPFGLCFDEKGNLYSSDCHSSPLYQLLRGGDYPSFGKIPEGLGFAPLMVQHSHNSTAIAGISVYADDRFPEEYQGNFFVGNVMTSKVNRDRVETHGSTHVGKEAPDLVTTSDPWFRPVDTQLGPDGALYIADFYNRIIGHYEVPLTHPGRDRASGRIWKVVYKGKDAKPRRRMDLAKANVPALIEALNDANLTYRMLAMNQLVDRIGSSASKPVLKSVTSRKSSAFQKAHGLWVLQRLETLTEKTLLKVAKSGDAMVAVHALKIFSERPDWTSAALQFVHSSLQNQDAWVQRAAAEALAQKPRPESIEPLLQLRHAVPAADTHLLYMTRMALRNQLSLPGSFTHISGLSLTEKDHQALADGALGVKSPEAGTYLLAHLEALPSRQELTRALRHISRYAPPEAAAAMARIAQEKFATQPDYQFELFESVVQGAEQRGEPLGKEVKTWGAQLAAKFLEPAARPGSRWAHLPLDAASAANPWTLQTRPSSDGTSANFLTSLLGPEAEAGTGTLRSETFRAPATLRFFVAGHRGLPERPAHSKNVIRLKTADTDEILVETYPPRNDLAQPVQWDLTKWAGREVHLEATDGDKTREGYAWLAFGRFDPPVVSLPEVSPAQLAIRQQKAADLVIHLELPGLEASLVEILNDPLTDGEARAAVAKALVLRNGKQYASTVAPLLGDERTSIAIRQKMAQALNDSNSPEARLVLVESLRIAPFPLQIRLAQGLTSNQAGAEALLKMIEEGKASPRLLQERAIADRVVAAKARDGATRIQKLTANLPLQNFDLQKLIETRRASYQPARARASEGLRVFTQNCAACHQFGGQGGLIGPQLDGIATRGIDRLIEDIIDPNRNVDHAFRSSVVQKKDGDVLSGLFRREEGEVVVFADASGKEISVPKNEIQMRKESDISLMPEGLGESISAEDFHHLLAFLLSRPDTQSATGK